MKKTLWITISAISAAAVYLLLKKCAPSSSRGKTRDAHLNKHHITNAFSKAKQHAVAE